MNMIIRKSLIAGMAALVCLASCKKEKELTDIQLNLSEVILSEGDTLILTAGVKPDADSLLLEWSTLDTTVAVVSDGIVKAVASGETYILASVGTVSKGCLVTVIASVKGITLDKSLIYMTPDSSVAITATVNPAHALNPAVHWTTSDPNVAVVSDGLVLARSKGLAEITATTEDGGYAATCKVEVMAMPTAVVLTPDKVEVDAGKTVQLEAAVLPDEIFTRKDVVWTSSDHSVATVSETGLVTGVAKGTAVIKAVSVVNGVYATCEVEVKAPVTGVSLTETSVKVYLGDRHQLTAVVYPENANNKGVTWTSSKETVATVTSEGLVFAFAVGKATITVTTDEGGFTAECVIDVIKGDQPVTGVTLDRSSLTLVSGRSAYLIPTVSPVAAIDKSVVWSTEDADIADVDPKTGKVTAGRKAGHTVITAKTVNGGFEASCAVTVVNFDSELPGYDDEDYEWKD